MNLSLRTAFLIGLAMLLVAVSAASVSYRMGIMRGSVEAGIAESLVFGGVLTDLAKPIASVGNDDTLLRIMFGLDVVKQSLSGENARWVPEQRDQINRLLVKIDLAEKEIQPGLDKAAVAFARRRAEQRMRELAKPRVQDSSKGH